MLRTGVPRFAVACAIAGACSSYRGAPDVPAGDAGGVDGGVDASPEASGDDAGSTDAGASTFCADATWVCDDFDDPSSGWPSPEWIPIADADVALTDASTPTAPSPPNAASFTLEASDAATSAWISNGIAKAITGFRCEMQLLVVERPATMDLFSVHITPTSDSLAMTTGGAFAYGQLIPTAPLSTNAWTKVVVDVDLGKSVTITLNGVVQPSTVDAGAAATSATGALLYLGASRSVGEARGRVLYDDVRCDVR